MEISMSQMEKTKINVRGTMQKMAVNDVIEFLRPEVKPLSTRSTATLIKENTGKGYSVSVKTDKIIVTRLL
jgi:hypothetical protein